MATTMNAKQEHHQKEQHTGPAMYDGHGRRINYIRISLTDACNLRCVYCMPEVMHFRPRPELLQDDEILFLVRAAAAEGADKVRLTGGEPTVRAGLVELVREIARVPGIREVAMTTNGLLLNRLAAPLAEAGLTRVNISLDTLDPEKFKHITRRDRLGDVWIGISAAEAAGLRPVKINCVVTRGHNENEVADLARLSIDSALDIRFIELMPLGSVSGFQQEAVVPFQETMAQIEAKLGTLLEVPGHDPRDPARPYRLAGARGTLGFISSVTKPFCADCNRVRITADGKLRLCLLRDDEADLMTPLRNGASEEEIRRILREAVARKPWGHGLEENVVAASRVMSEIGG